VPRMAFRSGYTAAFSDGMGWDGVYMTLLFFSLWVDGRAYEVFRDLGGRRGVGWGSRYHR
jgi:hypothetical protein